MSYSKVEKETEKKYTKEDFKRLESFIVKFQKQGWLDENLQKTEQTQLLAEQAELAKEARKEGKNANKEAEKAANRMEMIDCFLQDYLAASKEHPPIVTNKQKRIMHVENADDHAAIKENFNELSKILIHYQKYEWLDSRLKITDKAKENEVYERQLKPELEKFISAYQAAYDQYKHVLSYEATPPAASSLSFFSKSSNSPKIMELGNVSSGEGQVEKVEKTEKTCSVM